MDKVFIHVDIDAFFAAVEALDNKKLRGKPLIIGALPLERGVVATCSYEARKYGIHSAMNIKTAYQRCPGGIFIHPNLERYKQISKEIHEIWKSYSNKIEYLSLDEGYIDITDNIHSYEEARKIALEIKHRTFKEIGITCSIGIGYNMMSAKLASEEKKPNGFFEIKNPKSLKKLIINRDVQIILGVGIKTAKALHNLGFNTVRDIYDNPQKLINNLGSHGEKIVDYANGFDSRTLKINIQRKSIGREHTFQKDLSNFISLQKILRSIAEEVSNNLRKKNLLCRTITLKLTYYDMKTLTRSKTVKPTNQTEEIYRWANIAMASLKKKPVRLLGISLSNLSDDTFKQLSLSDPFI